VNTRLALGISAVWIPLAFLFDGLTVLVLPVRVSGGGQDATLIGLISFVGLAAALGIQPLAGALSDRLRARFVRQAFMAVAAVPALGGLWLLTGATTIPLVALAYLIVQVSASAIQAAQQTLIPEHVPAAFRGRAGGLKTAADIGGAFVAFLVLGWLVGSGQLASVAGVISVALGGAVLLAWLLVPRDIPNVTPRRAAVHEGLPAGFIRLIAARFLFLLGIYVIGRFLLLLVAERLGIEVARAADETGGLLALFTLTTAVGALALGPLTDRYGRPRMMAGGAVVAAIGVLGFLPAAGLPGVLLAGVLMSLGTAAFSAGNWAAITDIVPATDSGRLMGLANIGTGGAAACAGLAGPLIDAAGFEPAILFAAVATIAALLPLSRQLAAAALEPVG
jgi:MFS family permease